MAPCATDLHDAAFEKLLCISRSTSRRSKSEVMCLMTFLGVQAAGEKKSLHTDFSVGKTEMD